MFKQAARTTARLRLTIDGPSGSGKSFSALRLAHFLARGGKIAVIDTERGSASKYVGEAPDGLPWRFDVAELTDFSPDRYTQMVQMAGKMGYAVLIIDSLSHAWEGAGGALDLKDRAGGSWTAWRNVTPLHNRMIDAILQSPMHVITTMRSRMEYVQETDSAGKTVVRRVGMAPVQRPGMEYEFDVVMDIDQAHIATVSKSRCSAIADMKMEKPGPEFAELLLAWLDGGAPAARAARPAITLDDLVARFGADRVMAANEGNIPSDDDELRAVAALLAGAETVALNSPNA